MTLNPAEIELGLTRVARVRDQLPQPGYKPIIITIAGTNGKGSTVALLQSIYLAAGFTVGCYTSPHLLRYNERISLNGKPASDEAIMQAFEQIDQARGELPLTFFEYGTLAAMVCSLQAKVEVILLEVGLGGRLDAVNIFEPDVAVVTSVGIDHTDWLGDTREAIGREKAGIFRRGKPAICADPNPPQSIFKSVPEVDVDVLGQAYHLEEREGDWSWWNDHESYSSLPLPALVGAEQLLNAAAVLQVISYLQTRLAVLPVHLEAGLQQASLEGRYQQISRECTVVLDVAHNAQATQALAKKLTLEAADFDQTIAVVGVMADKAVADLLDPLLSEVDVWYCVQPKIERAMEQNAITAVLHEKGQTVIECASNVGQALESVLSQVGVEDRVLIFGSFFTVAESLSYLHQ
ncbi:MAG: bifunctional tetrahydrofolate synthase/dihydrofolate synthase [Methylococcales bacterium]|nr:bifunctional tetrahydrofolate synthase/dihydrofolate synthase [Methylococcales bacterium]MBT7444846.1 bifunctional tetrahydrofolate synthase/dihydrofolate synthase [Methylococcales bacterium]